MPITKTNSLTITEARSHFPIFTHQTYIASCAKGALSEEAKKGVNEFLKGWEELGEPMESKWIGLIERSRLLFAELIHAKADEIAIFSSVSAAVGAIASCFYPKSFPAFGDRNEVLVDTTNFPTIGHIWELRGHEGVKLIRVPVKEEEAVTPAMYEPFVTEHTLLINLSTVAYRTGVKVDLKQMVDWAHSRGIMVLVDDAQINGTRELDVPALDIDFLVAPGMKYLCAPPGIAFLYVKQPLIERLEPSVAGWFAHKQLFTSLEEKGDDLIMHADERIWDSQSFTYAGSARRFEQGTPNVFDAAATMPALKLLRDIGLPQIEHQIAHLTEKMIAGLHTQNITCKTPDDPRARGPLVTLQVKEPAVLAEKLMTKHVHTSPRGSNGLRFAFHFYNNDEDVERALQALHTYKALM